MTKASVPRWHRKTHFDFVQRNFPGIFWEVVILLLDVSAQVGVLLRDFLQIS